MPSAFRPDVTAVLEPAERARLQLRTLRVLTLGQMVGAAALASAITVGAFVVQDILGQHTAWVGMSPAGVKTGTATFSQVLSRRMRKRGRRPGMQLGYGLAACGGFTAAFGAQQRWLPVFLVGLFLYGSGSATNLLARYAATDLALPDERSRAMSRVLFASAFGAVFGPMLIGPAEHLGQSLFGLTRYAGPFLFSSCFFTAAFINITIQLRPDPLVLAGGTSRGVDEGRRRTQLADAVRIIFATKTTRLALLAMVITQATMVGVMAMAPVHLKLHGHEAVSQFVISSHIGGMYVFSPWVGRFSDRRGRLPSLVVGSGILMAAVFLSAVMGDGALLMFPAMWALGLGWTFGLIGASSLMMDAVSLKDRVAVQGGADLMMSVCGGTAGLLSGFVRAMIGFHMLSAVALVATGALFVATYSAYRAAGGGASAPALLEPAA